MTAARAAPPLPPSARPGRAPQSDTSPPPPPGLLTSANITIVAPAGKSGGCSRAACRALRAGSRGQQLRAARGARQQDEEKAGGSGGAIPLAERSGDAGGGWVGGVGGRS